MTSSLTRRSVLAAAGFALLMGSVPALAQDVSGELVILQWQGGTDAEMWAKLEADFAAKNPGVTVRELVVTGQGDMRGPMRTALLGGEKVDIIINTWPAFRAELADAGILRPIDDLWASANLDSVLDQSWKDHLLALDHLKEGIGLRGYAQRDPLNEYKRESYDLFTAMKDRVEDTVIRNLFRVEPVSEEQMAEERAKLWKARHDAYWAGLALKPGHKALSTDVCVPISRLADCIAETEADLAESGLTAPIVGHVGDGNFHVLVLMEPGNASDLERTEAFVSRLNIRAIGMDGTCTGEHGIGQGKTGYLARELGPAVDYMAAVKHALDPKGILNPGKIFRV